MRTRQATTPATTLKVRTTKAHTHTSTGSPSSSKFGNKGSGAGRGNNNINNSKEAFFNGSADGNVTAPSLLWTAQTEQAVAQLTHDEIIHTHMATIAVQIEDITPAFHAGTSAGDLHCDDCEVLPRGVGLLLSAFFGSAFFIAYLFIVTVVWQRCPQISKPPDARLQALEEARRPTISSRLLLMAQQAAGGLGVPIKPPVTTITTCHEAPAEKTSDIVNFWSRIATTHVNLKPMTSCEVRVAPQDIFAELDDDDDDNSNELEKALSETFVDILQEQEVRRGHRHNNKDEPTSLRRSVSALPGSGGHGQKMARMPTIRSATVTTSTSNPTPIPAPAEPEIVPVPSSPSPVPVHTISSMKTAAQRPKAMVSGESSFDEGENFTRPKRYLCSPILGSKLFSKRRRTTLVRQRSLTFSPNKWLKESATGELESPIFAFAQQQQLLSSPQLAPSVSMGSSSNGAQPNASVTREPAVGPLTTLPTTASFVSSSSTGAHTTTNSTNEFGDFVILLPIPRSVTTPTVHSRLVHRSDGARSPPPVIAMSPPPKSASSMTAAGLTSPGAMTMVVNESGVFTNDDEANDSDEIWVSKFKAAQGTHYARPTRSSSGLDPNKCAKMKNSRADFYSNSKFLFMND